MCARTDLWEPRGSNPPGPPGEFVCPNRVATSPNRSTQMGHINSLDGDSNVQDDRFIEVYGLLVGDDRSPRMLLWNRVEK